MSQYYSIPRKRWLFEPQSKYPFRISRSKIDLFLNCPRCFYLDLRLGIKQPGGFPFTLNSAVDTLLKKEFDIHRGQGTPHPLMKSYKIKAVPLAHEKLNDWRTNFIGVQYFHRPTNFLVFGAIDDLWINDKKELIVVDYKATATTKEVTLDDDWKIGYKRQMEIYQWLFRQNGFKVLDTGYFVYCNGQTDKEAFDGRLEFEVKILAYKGSDSWVESVLKKARQTLRSSQMPSSGKDCDFCAYRKAVKDTVEKRQQ